MLHSLAALHQVAQLLFRRCLPACGLVEHSLRQVWRLCRRGGRGIGCISRRPSHAAGRIGPRPPPPRRARPARSAPADADHARQQQDGPTKIKVAQIISFRRATWTDGSGPTRPARRGVRGVTSHRQTRFDRAERHAARWRRRVRQSGRGTTNSRVDGRAPHTGPAPRQRRVSEAQNVRSQRRGQISARRSAPRLRSGVRHRAPKATANRHRRRGLLGRAHLRVGCMMTALATEARHARAAPMSLSSAATAGSPWSAST